MSSLNCDRQQFVKFRGTLQNPIGLVQDGRLTGHTWCERWSPIVSAALYRLCCAKFYCNVNVNVDLYSA